MANDPKQPLMFELSVDATDLTFLVDIEPGARLGLRSAQPGFDQVVKEIKANQIVKNGASVIPDATYQELMLAEERIALIDAKLPAAHKLFEMMEETRALLDDQRQRVVSAIASMAEAQAKAFGDSGILARYAKTRAYRSAAALKAARTRRRNQEEELEAGEPGGGEPGDGEPGEPGETIPAEPVQAGPASEAAIVARPASPDAPAPTGNH